jgi:hypothetical protein
MEGAFLWKGRKDIKGGHCLVGWQRVCRPTDLGGLGILNLEVLSWALQMRWMWLQKTQPDRPWSNLDIQVHPSVSALFIISVTSLMGDGRSTCFWVDLWLHGQKIQDLAPALFASVPKQIAKKGLFKRRWKISRGCVTLGGVCRPMLCLNSSSSGTFFRNFT